MTKPPAVRGERLQKAMANAGLGSRREIEGWIAAGRVEINGRVARLGDRVQPEDQIRVDGKPLSARRMAPVAQRVIAYNKPEGELVSRADPEGRPLIFQNLPRLDQGRWINVGRLDINSAGLLLLTTDGELANRLMHPSRSVDREYAVRVLGKVGSQMLQQLRDGIELEDGPARFEDIVDNGGSGANHWYHVVIREGRQREVRRMWEAVGVRVSRLIRVRFANVVLGNRTRQGRWREIEGADLKELYRWVDLEPPAPRPKVAAARSGERQPRPAKRQNVWRQRPPPKRRGR